MRQTHLATAGFRSAISTEQICLDGLVSMAEQEQRYKARYEAMPHEEREIYDKALAEVKELVKSERPILSEICKWEEIIKPAPVENIEIQRQIEAEYENAMDERNKWLAKLKERCARDAVFARLLCGKMVEGKYPEKDILKIIPVSLYVKCSGQG